MISCLGSMYCVRDRGYVRASLMVTTCRFPLLQQKLLILQRPPELQDLILILPQDHHKLRLRLFLHLVLNQQLTLPGLNLFYELLIPIPHPLVLSVQLPDNLIKSGVPLLESDGVIYIDWGVLVRMAILDMVSLFMRMEVFS